MVLKKCLVVFIGICFAQLLFGQGRDILDFNENWRFVLEDDLQFRHMEYEDGGWKQVQLPHDWSIGFDFGEEYPAGNAGGALPGGVGWYRKEFSLDSKDQGKAFFVRFGGVYRYAEVWINGHYLGKHINGYLSFEHDLTPYVRFDRANVIAVRADNSLQPNSRWYTGSGIYRNVTLEVRAQRHLVRSETYVTTPGLEEGHHAVRVVSSLSGGLSGKKQAVLLELKDRNNRTVVAKTIEIAQPVFDETLVLDKVELWDPDSPNLYRLHIALLDSNKEVADRLEYAVGFRYFRFDTENGFFLNGKPLKLLGVCLHHDLGLLGAAFNKSAAKRQLVLMKKMGANAIRTAHNPPAEELLDLCDELGLLVYNEAFDMWRKRKNKFDYHIDFDEHHISDLENFVRRDRNHPSVFMWSIGNEIREQFDASGIELTKNMAEVVKRLDPTRPVTAALTETDYEKNFIAQAKALDVLGFNYKYFDYDKLPSEFPGYPLIASETTSGLQTRGVYDPVHDTLQYWPASAKDKFVTNGNPDFTVSAYDNVAAYWGASHETAWLEVKERDFLGGIFVWTGFDYLGEPVPYPFPARSSYYGIVDLAGLPKDVYHMYRSEWTDEEVLHLLPHWNWQAGDTVDVWCYYSKADEVELFLNGRSVGKSSKSGDRLHAVWKVPFEAGELKAVKYRDGVAVQEAVVRTAGSPVDVLVDLEHEKYATGGKEDLHFITVTLLDSEGNTVPHQDMELSFEAVDNITIVGTDNGYQADLNSLAKPLRRTFKGKAVAFAKKERNDRSGRILLRGDGFEKEIQVE